MYRYRLREERGAGRKFEIIVRVTQLWNGGPYRIQLSVVPVTALIDLAEVRGVR